MRLQELSLLHWCVILRADRSVMFAEYFYKYSQKKGLMLM